MKTNRNRVFLFLPILFLYIFSTSQIWAEWKPAKVSIKTRDGVKLRALYQKPTGDAPVVVCLHGLASSKEEWIPFGKYVVEHGWGVLAYDARGHGESSESKDLNGNPDGYQYFGRPGPGTQWEKMVDDVGSVLAFLRINQKLDTQPIVLSGASLGANVAVNYVALTRSVKALVVLSAGINYAGFDTSEPIQHIKDTAILMIASRSDSNAYESGLRLVDIRPDIPLWTNVKGGHGVQMLDEDLMKRIYEWLQKKK